MSTADVLQAREAGLLGAVVFHHLCSAGYQVRVFTPKNSAAEFSGVTFAPIYYKKQFVKKALRDYDAMVSVVPMFFLEQRLRLLSCIVGAGIKRFVAIEPGWPVQDSWCPSAAPQRLFKQRRMDRVLERERTESGLVYTLIRTGLCLDPGPQDTCLFDVNGRSARIYGGGDTKVSVTTCAHVAQAIATALDKPGETGNRALRIKSLAIAQRSMLQMLKEVSGSSGWSEEALGVEQLGHSWVSAEREGELV